jgi:hypothetical protein
MAMDKRQPLSVMIALQKKPGSDKDRGSDTSSDDAPDDSDDSRYAAPALISAAEDAIDAFKNRDAKALVTALCHFLDAHGPVDHSEPDEDDK